MHFANSKITAKYFAIVAFELFSEHYVVQLLINSFTGHLCGILVVAGILQALFSGLLAASTVLLAVGRAVENIRQFFCIFRASFSREKS